MIIIIIIICSPTLVIGHAHGAVPLVVGHAGLVGTVDGDLQVVSPQPVPVGVRVREQAALGTPVDKSCHALAQ